MKHLILIMLFVCISVHGQQCKYFQVDSTHAWLKMTVAGMKDPLYADVTSKKANSEISLPLEGEAQMKEWMKSALQEVFGPFPLEDKLVKLLNGVSINTGFDRQLKVIYYEYKVDKELFALFVKHEEAFDRLGKLFLKEDMSRYFKIEHPDLYHYCAYSFPLGTIYRTWCKPF